MKITTIISALHTKDYVLEALESVRQSDEILLGIDACKDTFDVVKGLKWDNLKIYWFPKCTTYKIRNTLAQLASNEMLLFFDSDDIMTRWELIRAASGDIVRFKFSNFRDDMNIAKFASYYSPGCFMIKKDLFLYYNGFQGCPCSADSEFMMRVDKHHKVATINESLFYRRQHSEALTLCAKYGLKSRTRQQINRNLHRNINQPILSSLATSRYKQWI